VVVKTGLFEPPLFLSDGSKTAGVGSYLKIGDFLLASSHIRKRRAGQPPGVVMKSAIDYKQE